MLNTRELEKRWLKYKIKSYIPHLVIFISLIIISTTLFIFLNNSNEKEKHTTTRVVENTPTTQKSALPSKIEQNNTQDINSISTKEKSIPKPIQMPITPPLKTKTTDANLKLQPSMGFINHIQSEEQQPYYKTLHASPPKKRVKRKVIKEKVEEEYMDITQNSHKKAPVVQKKSQRTVEEPAEQRQVITIERRDSQKDIQDIIARFKNNNNPALSLFVAKKSYEIGDYKQAYNYALITNGINHNIEESWLIFAKSLVKLHKREMAIKTLDEYIKYSHSSNARILLNEIKAGKFQ